MSKNTPGPWLLQLSHSGARIVKDIREDKKPLRYEVICSGFAGHRANARLIAAAPDMLDALRTAERLLLDGVGHEKVRAAIAKATGDA